MLNEAGPSTKATTACQAVWRDPTLQVAAADTHQSVAEGEVAPHFMALGCYIQQRIVRVSHTLHDEEVQAFDHMGDNTMSCIKHVLARVRYRHMMCLVCLHGR